MPAPPQTGADHQAPSREHTGATGRKDKMSACEEGCITVSHCLHDHHDFEEKDSSMASDMSKSCLTTCEGSCSQLYGEKANLGHSCVSGCEAQHLQIDGLGTSADAQYLSQRVEILEDAVPSIGIKENKTHNVSLNLGGNIQTNVTSNTLLGPMLEKDGISTIGGKKVEDRAITFDLQGNIDNDTIAEETLSKHGKKGVVSYGKRGKEYSENTSINIQGVLSRNGSYMDVSSHYKPHIKRTSVSPPVKKRKGKRRKKRSKRMLRRRPKQNRLKNRKTKKPKADKVGNTVPQEVKTAVKTPVAKG